MALLASLRRDTSPPLFVTLTYPARWDPDPERWKRDLHAWVRRLLRRYPHASVIWRLEFQERGAPHFHLLVFGVEFIPARWVSRTWAEVVGSGDPRHERAGTRVERVRSWRGVMRYASKYLAKPQEGPTGWTGRVWGVYGRANLPLATFVAVRLTLDQFADVRRILARLVGLSLRGWTLSRGLWIFGRARAVLRLAHELVRAGASIQATGPPW